MSRVVAVANQKGGVGKTTTVVTLGAALAELGQRVLVVDLDAQGCATFSLGVDPEDLDRSVADVLIARARTLPSGRVTTSAATDAGTFTARDSLAGLIRTTADGVDLIPAALDLAGLDHALAGRRGREYVLRDALAEIRDRYDWVLIDCSPSLGIATIGALTAADEVIIPFQCETLSHRGVSQLMETIAEVQRLTNPALVVAGILPTLFDGRNAHAQAILDDLPRRYGLPVFMPINRSIRFAEAPAVGRTVLATMPGSRPSYDYRDLARTLLAK